MSIHHRWTSHSKTSWTTCFVNNVPFCMFLIAISFFLLVGTDLASKRFSRMLSVALKSYESYECVSELLFACNVPEHWKAPRHSSFIPIQFQPADDRKLWRILRNWTDFHRVTTDTDSDVATIGSTNNTLHSTNCVSHAPSLTWRPHFHERLRNHWHSIASNSNIVESICYPHW